MIAGGTPVEIIITEVNRKDTRAVFSWIRDSSKNMMDLWDTVIPIIKSAVKDEFSDKNPNQWKAIKPSYARWKVKHGYPSTIGVKTGILKASATDDAIVTKKPSLLRYEVNMVMTGKKKGQPYAFWFNRQRPIFLYSEKYINTVIDKAADEFLSKKVQKYSLKDFRK